MIGKQQQTFRVNHLQLFNIKKVQLTPSVLSVSIARELSTSHFQQNDNQNGSSQTSLFNDEMWEKLDSLLQDYRSLQAQRDTADAGSAAQTDLNKRLNTKAGLIDAIERVNELRHIGDEVKELLDDDDAEMYGSCLHSSSYLHLRMSLLFAMVASVLETLIKHSFCKGVCQ